MKANEEKKERYIAVIKDSQGTLYFIETMVLRTKMESLGDMLFRFKFYIENETPEQMLERLERETGHTFTIFKPDFYRDFLICGSCFPNGCRIDSWGEE
jgi:hypothetical protein